MLNVFLFLPSVSAYDSLVLLHEFTASSNYRGPEGRNPTYYGVYKFISSLYYGGGNSTFYRVSSSRLDALKTHADEDPIRPMYPSGASLKRNHKSYGPD